jgi:hypothetical protein
MCPAPTRNPIVKKTEMSSDIINITVSRGKANINQILTQTNIQAENKSIGCYDSTGVLV